jgi:hypothetical protein
MEILRLFNQHVDRIERSGLARRYAEGVPHLIAKMEPLSEQPKQGGVQMKVLASFVEEFNEDEIGAFVLSYRLLTQKNDRLSIRSLARIYAADWMPREAGEAFEDARRQLNGYLETPATVMFGDNQLTLRRLAEVLIYGGLAHSNKALTPIYEKLGQFPRRGFFLGGVPRLCEGDDLGSGRQGCKSRR